MGALSLVVLGGWHGINPAMGWLFAVALGMQERRPRAVWRAMGPLAAGHALAVGAAVALALALGAALPVAPVRWSVGLLLVGLGLFRLWRHRHPQWIGMQVTPAQLTAWSFLMASAHGAGLMVVPFVMAHGGGAPVPAHAIHRAGMLPPLAGLDGGIRATALHTAGYLAVTALVAALVYGRLGLRLLRTLWFNLDRVWAGALILTGLVTPFL